MKIYISLLFLFLFSALFGTEQPKSGEWIGKLELDATANLPFRLQLKVDKIAPQISIFNGKEQIDLIYNRNKADTLVYTFPEFDSDLYLLVTSNKKMIGYWHNKNKKGNYTIPLTAHYCKELLFECEANSKKTFGLTLAKKWRTVFDKGSKDEFPAIGLFEQNGLNLSGTFLTETGDYRFLDGNFFDNQLFLSCFDGSHAFLFTATLTKDTLNGFFYSGKHYKTTWTAHPDDNYELQHPDKLTYVINENPLHFEFKDLNNNSYQYPNKELKNKVAIIQIMGSWCPNCMDETRYFMELYEQYHNQGLEIIMIGYEAGNDENDYIEKLKRLQARYSIPFTMLVGGAANKNKASNDFSMLNEIISFPTSIFIDRFGNIRKVHTGFNGPSTGNYYSQYILQTDNLIKELLKNE